MEIESEFSFWKTCIRENGFETWLNYLHYPMISVSTSYVCENFNRIVPKRNAVRVAFEGVGTGRVGLASKWLFNSVNWAGGDVVVWRFKANRVLV